MVTCLPLFPRSHGPLVIGREVADKLGREARNVVKVILPHLKSPESVAPRGEVLSW